MAQGVKKNLTYERLGVLVSDFPAYKTAGSTTGDLMRLQSVDFSFNHPAMDVKSIGSTELVTRGGESPVVRQPDIQCNMSYIFTSGENESNIGLYVGHEGSILKNFFNEPKTDDVNIIVVGSNSNRHLDVNLITDPAEFSGYDVIGIGNCFLTKYSYSAQVGELPTCSLSYNCSNIQFDTYIPGSEPYLPAVNLVNGTSFSSEIVKLDENSFSEHMSDSYVGGIMPGSIIVTITKNAGDYGGVPAESIYAAIQSMNIDVPLGRQDIWGFGSNYVFNRKAKYPVIGSVGMDMIIREFATGKTDSFFTQGTRYDIEIQNRKRYSDGSYDNICRFEITNAQLKQQNFDFSIGGNASVSSTFSFGISPSGGLKLIAG